jgi:hypothetical protein
MAQRDEQIESGEFLEWILALRRSQMQRVGVLPVITILPGCAAFVVPGDRRLRTQLSRGEAGLAAQTC